MARSPNENKPDSQLDTYLNDYGHCYTSYIPNALPAW